MEQAYLFVHFKEKKTPDGEQVYFGLSRDGFHWETVNQGKPVLWCYYGERGARDFTITHCRFTGKYYIIGTDLSLAYGMRNQYQNSWQRIAENGSDSFSVWESENLVDWTEQKLVKPGKGRFGCLWAPDVIYDQAQQDYVLHWSSPNPQQAQYQKAIFYSRTKDFTHFLDNHLLYQKADSGVIDSAVYEENGFYYMFLKSEDHPRKIILLRSDRIDGSYERVPAFDESMEQVEAGLYEAPTAVKLADGRWCLFLDYYGVEGAGQGYVPFVANSLASGRFIRADEQFCFPYGFKHGTILTITGTDYDRIRTLNL